MQPDNAALYSAWKSFESRLDGSVDTVQEALVEAARENGVTQAQLEAYIDSMYFSESSVEEVNEGIERILTINEGIGIAASLNGRRKV